LSECPSNSVIFFSVLLNLSVSPSAEVWSAVLIKNKADKRSEDVEEEGDEKRK